MRGRGGEKKKRADPGGVAVGQTAGCCHPQRTQKAGRSKESAEERRCPSVQAAHVIKTTLMERWKAESGKRVNERKGKQGKVNLITEGRYGINVS